MTNAGKEPPEPPQDLLASVAWSREGETTYAFDGGVFTAGTAIGWLRSPGVVADAAETAELALSVGNTGGVHFLPAFTGLGAPWWDGEARGVFSGITGGTTRAHLVRAVLDAGAFRVRDVLEAVWKGGRPKPQSLRVDRGLTKDRYLMQRQAGLIGLPVELGPSSEATATGAAALAATSAGLLDEHRVRERVGAGETFEPRLWEDERDAGYAGWLGAGCTGYARCGDHVSPQEKDAGFGGFAPYRPAINWVPSAIRRGGGSRWKGSTSTR